MLDVHLSIASVAIFAAVLIVSLIILLVYLHPGSKKATTVPGPSVVDSDNGNLTDIERAGSLQSYLMQTHKQFGSLISFYIGKKLVISTSNIKNFAPRSQVVEIPGLFFESWKSCVGRDSFIFARGTSIFQRRDNLDFEVNAKLKEKYAKIFNTMVGELVKKWKSQPDDQHIPLTRHLQTLSTKAVSKLIFGKFFNNPANVLRLHQCWDKCWTEVVSRTRNEPSKPEEEIKKDASRLREVVEEAIEDRWSDKSEDKLPVLIDALLQASNNHLSRQQLVADAITLFTVGIQSTVSVLSWTIYSVVRERKVQMRLRERLSDAHSLDIMPESLVDHKYMQAIIKESVRHGEIFTWCGRQQDLDLMLDQKHLVHKQTPIIEAVSVAMLDEERWENPFKFDPDRFCKDNVGINPLHFIPFSFATSRKFPQDSLVYVLAAIATGVLTREFDLKMADDDDDKEGEEGSRIDRAAISFDNLTSMPSSEEIWITASSPSSRQETNTGRAKN